MPATIDKPRPTHREARPIRECLKCGCFLRTGNESTFCTPCGTPEWEKLDQEVWERLSSLKFHGRRQVFTVLDDLESLMAEEPA